MWFPTYYLNSKICGDTFNYLFQATHNVFWQPDCFLDCWYIDALTVDAHKLAAEIKGVWDKTAGRRRTSRPTRPTQTSARCPR